MHFNPLSLHIFLCPTSYCPLNIPNPSNSQRLILPDYQNKRKGIGNISPFSLELWPQNASLIHLLSCLRAMYPSGFSVKYLHWLILGQLGCAKRCTDETFFLGVSVREFPDEKLESVGTVKQTDLHNVGASLIH